MKFHHALILIKSLFIKRKFQNKPSLTAADNNAFQILITYFLKRDILLNKQLKFPEQVSNNVKVLKICNFKSTI